MAAVRPARLGRSRRIRRLWSRRFGVPPDRQGDRERATSCRPGAGAEDEMETLREILPLAILVSLIAMEVDLGLNATLDDLLYVLRRPRLLAKALLAVSVIVPIAAAILVSLFPLTPVARGGIILMAVSSVPPLAPEKSLKAGGEKCYTYGVYTALVLLSVFIVPLSVEIMSRIYDVDVPLRPRQVLIEVVERVLLPVAAGLLIRRFAPDFARRLAPMVGRFATWLLMLALVPLVVAIWPAMMSLIGNGTFLAMALVAAVALAGGHLLGGPEPANRGALAMMAATRHPGIALMIAGAAGYTDKRVTAAILAVVLVGMLVGIPYQMWLKRRRTPHAPAGAVPA
jgi:BASS family bile acid:Na+ symporter